MWFVLLIASNATAQTRISVPFVGCRSDGQLGPRTAPKQPPRDLHIDADGVQNLVYYRAQDGPGVLGPRGWFCFGTYGSSGSAIFVTPSPIDGKLLFSDTWRGFEGPAIQLSAEDGGTSGRFAVANVIARVFPAYKAFVTAVQNGGFLPSTTNFASGPYPTDRLNYLNRHAVEFTTPPNKDGLGTDFRLLKSSLPITGVEILTGADTDLISLSLRLPAEIAGLAPAIQHQVVREYAAPPPDPAQLP